MENEIIEGNKLIAEFMGALFVEEGIALSFSPIPFLPTQLKYHTSWDWLMPVVEKIEKEHKCIVEIRNNICVISNSHFVKFKHGGFNTDETKTSATYKAVLQFITWFNNQKD